MNGIICLACKCLIQINYVGRDGTRASAPVDHLMTMYTENRCPACESTSGFREALESDGLDYSEGEV